MPHTIVCTRLRQAHILGLGAFLVMPLAVYGPKTVAPVFVATAVLSAALELWRTRRFPRPTGGLTVIFALFLLWAAASAVWSMTPGETVKTGVSFAGTLLAGLVLVRNAARIDRDGRSFFERSLIAGGAVAFVLLAVELIGDADIYKTVQTLRGRASGYPDIKLIFNQSLSLASVFVWIWALCLWNRGLKLLAVGLGSAVGGVLALGEAASPLIALVLGAAGFVAFLLGPRIAVAAMAVIVASGVFAAPLLSKAIPPTADLVRRAPDMPPSAYHRLHIWRVTARHIADRPLLGHGFDTSRAFYDPSTRTEEVFYDAEGVPRWYFGYEPIPLHPHNGVLQVWLELGLIGAGLGLLALLAILKALAERVHGRVAGAACFAAFVSALFVASVSFGIWQSWWLSALWLFGAFATVAATARADEEFE